MIKIKAMSVTPREVRADGPLVVGRLGRQVALVDVPGQPCLLDALHDGRPITHRGLPIRPFAARVGDAGGNPSPITPANILSARAAPAGAGRGSGLGVHRIVARGKAVERPSRQLYVRAV